MIETMLELKLRHRAEVKLLLLSQANQMITQTEAARNLGMTLSGLNNLVCRLNIHWPVKMPGRHKSNVEQLK
jgi:hypothetical protein